MRYFLGIRPPSVLLDSVERFRQQQGWHGLEPHITVKAPCGLDGPGEWLLIVRQLCQGVPVLPIEISGIGTFGNTVLFLRVVSPALLALHHSLLRELAISDTDRAACYEGARYTPHLTLLHRPAPAAILDSTAALASDYFPETTSFRAVELLVYRKDEEGDYQILETIPFSNNSPVSSLTTPA